MYMHAHHILIIAWFVSLYFCMNELSLYNMVCMILFQRQNQNVYRIQSVQPILHVSKKNAKILVSLIHVDKTLNARLNAIEDSVFVSMVL